MIETGDQHSESQKYLTAFLKNKKKHIFYIDSELKRQLTQVPNWDCLLKKQTIDWSSPENG
jgi:hypothetical protein